MFGIVPGVDCAKPVPGLNETSFVDDGAQPIIADADKIVDNVPKVAVIIDSKVSRLWLVLNYALGKTAALMASSAAASRAASAAQSSVVNLGADRSSILSPAPVEIGGADMATPLAGGQTQATLRLAGIRSPSVERRTDSTAGQSSSDGARSLEEAGDFAAAEKYEYAYASEYGYEIPTQEFQSCPGRPNPRRGRGGFE